MKDNGENNTLNYRRRKPPAEMVGDGLAVPAPVPAGLPSGVSLPHQVALLAVWPFLEQIMNFLVGMVDTTLAARLKENLVESTNAVGTGAYVLWLLHLMIGAVAVGATALIARSAGAGKWRRANAVLGQALSLGAFWGTVLGVLLYLGAPALASASGLKGLSNELCVLYLRVLALAAPFTTILNVGSACLRGSGDTRTPFTIMIVVNAVNVAVSVALSASISPWGTYGLLGIAIGTVAAWMVGATLIVIELARGRGKVRLQPRNFRLRGHIPRRLVRIGLPSLLENGGQWIGNFLVVAIVGRLSLDAAMGAHVIAIRVEALSFMPGFALGLAAATLAGQYLGVNDAKTARRAVWWCYIYGGCVMTLLGALFIAVPEWFVYPITDEKVFREVCPQLLKIVGWAQPGFAACLVFSQALRGAGDTRTALVLTYASTFLVRLPLVWLFGIHWGYGLWGVWVALSSELLFRGVLFTVSFVRGNWAKVKV